VCFLENRWPVSFRIPTRSVRICCQTNTPQALMALSKWNQELLEPSKTATMNSSRMQACLVAEQQETSCRALITLRLLREHLLPLRQAQPRLQRSAVLHFSSERRRQLDVSPRLLQPWQSLPLVKNVVLHFSLEVRQQLAVSPRRLKLLLLPPRRAVLERAQELATC